MAAGRTLIEPKGYAAVTFVSTVMFVAGIGLSWTGLLLAAAGLILSVIEFKELQRLNPWLLPDNPEDSPLMAPGPRRVIWVSGATTVLGALAAVVAYKATDEPLSVIGPAAIAGITTIVLNIQFRQALAAGHQPGGE